MQRCRNVEKNMHVFPFILCFKLILMNMMKTKNGKGYANGKRLKAKNRRMNE